MESRKTMNGLGFSANFLVSDETNRRPCKHTSGGQKTISRPKSSLIFSRSGAMLGYLARRWQPSVTRSHASASKSYRKKNRLTGGIKRKPKVKQQSKNGRTGSKLLLPHLPSTDKCKCSNIFICICIQNQVRALDNLASFAGPILAGMSATLGMHVSLLVGGPEPRKQGKITVVRYVFLHCSNMGLMSHWKYA